MSRVGNENGGRRQGRRERERVVRAEAVGLGDGFFFGVMAGKFPISA